MISFSRLLSKSIAVSTENSDLSHGLDAILALALQIDSRLHTSGSAATLDDSTSRLLSKSIAVSTASITSQ